MKFEFDITLTDQDYLDFNLFHAFESPYRMKTIRNTRILLLIICGIGMLISLRGYNFELFGFFAQIPLVIFAVVLQLLLKPYFVFFIKYNIKRMKKTGKMAYSPNSHLIFTENSMVESTSTEKLEQLYTSIEQICIHKDKCIYIYVNNLKAFILPMSIFRSAEQYEEFVAFLKTLTDKIHIC